MEAHISPDGRLLAYLTNRTGRNEVYVRPFPSGGVEVQVSRDGASEPLWAPTGRELFYRGARHLLAAQIVTTPRLAVAHTDTLFLDTYSRTGAASNYSVFPDGKRFVMLRSASAARNDRPLIVRLNWNAGRGPGPTP